MINDTHSSTKEQGKVINLDAYRPIILRCRDCGGDFDAAKREIFPLEGFINRGWGTCKACQRWRDYCDRCAEDEMRKELYRRLDSI